MKLYCNKCKQKFESENVFADCPICKKCDNITEIQFCDGGLWYSLDELDENNPYNMS